MIDKIKEFCKIFQDPRLESERLAFSYLKNIYLKIS